MVMLVNDVLAIWDDVERDKTREGARSAGNRDDAGRDRAAAPGGPGAIH